MTTELKGIRQQQPPAAANVPAWMEWRALPYVTLMSAAFSFLLHCGDSPSRANPYLAVTVLFCWWVTLSVGYLAFSGRGSAGGWPFLHWLLSTARLRWLCLSGLLAGFLLILLLRTALPLFICLGLVWPGYFLQPADGPPATGRATVEDTVAQRRGALARRRAARLPENAYGLHSRS